MVSFRYDLLRRFFLVRPLLCLLPDDCCFKNRSACVDRWSFKRKITADGVDTCTSNP
jgi:hypothetical protein